MLLRGISTEGMVIPADTSYGMRPKHHFHPECPGSPAHPRAVRLTPV